ncbi:protease inhibitor protein [Microtetraspora sp. AC03309]|uniref:SSI family serine proteinase inhibitor n=1 Tax=Microtetraspora sp. AC03309 TaxID=2779376 RepID=UPI001E4F8320|nr:SSI family serine proteinase inhibitor [Microtetraspora sp. AC03309]MCC5581884.1 protease inhibitor protein [Microtetraspora sp. AC03309]
MRQLLALLAFTAIATGPASVAVAATVPPPWEPDVMLDAPVRIHPMKARAKALMMTVAKGPAGTQPQRYALLSCSPPSRGTHPAPTKACPMLEKVGGDPAKLQPDPTVACPMLFEPVTVTASGMWNDVYVRFERTYGNACQLRAMTGAIFAF